MTEDGCQNVHEWESACQKYGNRSDNFKGLVDRGDPFYRGKSD